MTRPLREFLELVGRLADPAARPAVARAVAARVGADDLIIFVRDGRVGGILLPAPGFAQTLPGARRWRAFLAGLGPGAPAAGPLPPPGRRSDAPALGLLAADGSALVLLGGAPAAADVAATILPLVPALAAAFRGEQALLAAEGHAAVARDTAAQAAMLTAALEGTRKALQGALATAEAANAAKDHFLAVLSHELRTPLAPVLTTAGALLDDRRLPDDVRESVEVIRRNAELEARLIDDLLDVTRIARGKMRLRLDVVDVHDLVAHTVEICRSDAYRKNLAIVDRLDAAARHVRGDPARLQQVLWNLLKNAVKFTPPGGRVEVRSRDAAGGRLAVEVSDTGIGVDPRHLATIFNAFEQSGEDVTRRYGGLGLGLAIARAIAAAHGGDLTASSEGPGKGTTFRLTLPVTEAPAPPPPVRGTAAGAGDGGGGTGAGRGLRLLLVEDHPDTARVMGRLLTNLGHDVTTAHTVAAALELPRGGQPFDLVLSDLGLPDGSGFDLMRRLREEHGLPGIAISGYGMEEDVARSEQAGFLAHLTKPVDFQKIRAVLNQYAAARHPAPGPPPG
jgi:signal transduction histidine kinase/ActR/RegA family two-component response regulator